MELPSYFRRYLREIQPSRSARERAAQLHKTLADRLSSDEPYQDCYLGTFLYGSYRRNTAIHGIKDVDVCVLLDLDVDLEADTPTPRSIVERLRPVLERNGYEAKTALQRRSVRVDLSGTVLDVVPVVAPDGEDEPLLIPDRVLTKWVKTNPKGHLKHTTELNRQNGGRFVPLVKIVKAWYRYQMRDVERPKPKGFVLETLVGLHQDPDAPSYAEAFVNFLANLEAQAGDQLAQGSFPTIEDPSLPGEILKLTISEDEARRFGEVVKSSRAAAQKALDSQDVAESAGLWRELLGPEYPKPPEKKSAAELRALEEAEQADDYADEEVGEVDLPPAPRLRSLRLDVQLANYKGGPLLGNYPSDGRSLAKGMWLRFAIAKTDAPAPYRVRWVVTNHGREAEAAHDMGHESWNLSMQWEHTKYRGRHSMICELSSGNVILARAKHIVNIR